MDNKKIRVAITHGDTNGIGYELIFKTFAEPEMLDFCTPIIYGSPKVAAYYRKAMNLPAQFSIIQKAEDAEEGRINLLAAVDEEVKIYDRERVVCDCLRHVNTMDGEVFNTVIQRYIGDKKKDAAKLMMYASKLGVEKKARKVVGIWL